MVLLVVDPGANLVADLLPAPRVDLVHHVHRASKIARHSVYAARNALQEIIQERLYIICVYVCMYAMYVRNTYTYTQTFMDLSKDFINI